MNDFGVGYSVHRRFIKIKHSGKTSGVKRLASGKLKRYYCKVPRECTHRQLKWALQVIATHLYNGRNGTSFTLPEEEMYIRANTRDKTYFGERSNPASKKKSKAEADRVLQMWKERRHAATGKRGGDKATLRYMAQIYKAGADGRDGANTSTVRTRRSRARKANQKWST